MIIITILHKVPIYLMHIQIIQNIMKLIINPFLICIMQLDYLNFLLQVVLFQLLQQYYLHFLNYLKICARSIVSAGQSSMVFGVSAAVIQNYRAKMPEKGPKRAQKGSNVAPGLAWHGSILGPGPKMALGLAWPRSILGPKGYFLRAFWTMFLLKFLKS